MKSGTIKIFYIMIDAQPAWCMVKMRIIAYHCIASQRAWRLIKNTLQTLTLTLTLNHNRMAGGVYRYFLT